MRKVEPKCFLVGETRVVEEGLKAYLAHIGAPEWHTDAPSDSEKIVEVMGRLCYRSWKPGMNANVTKVREGNDKYIGNIVNVRHGSVTEHAFINFIFADVSRVFTHELVRHRVGCAISQESLRFVRLDDLGLWAPTCIREDEHAMTIFAKTFEHLEQLQLDLAQHFKLDEPGVNFDKKKEITSAMRRIAPDGLATAIGWSANPRTIRHCLEMRTNRHAEEEIRLGFDQLGLICQDRYPNLFHDYTRELVNGIGEWKSPNAKI